MNKKFHKHCEQTKLSEYKEKERLKTSAATDCTIIFLLLLSIAYLFSVIRLPNAVLIKLNGRDLKNDEKKKKSHSNSSSRSSSRSICMHAILTWHVFRMHFFLSKWISLGCFYFLIFLSFIFFHSSFHRFVMQFAVVLKFSFQSNVMKR